jgi:UDPglucose 6-dehydrogenase
VGDKIHYGENQYDILKDADALVIVTEWSVFRTPDFDRVGSLLKSKVIFDGRNLYDLQKMIDSGYYYNSIGRKTISI